jgi:hypothetical protein
LLDSPSSIPHATTPIHVSVYVFKHALDWSEERFLPE